MELSCANDLISKPEIAAAIGAATIDVFTTMLGLELEAGSTEIGETAGSAQSGVVALLGLAGEWVGTGSLRCDPAFACKMASQLLLSEYDVINDEVLDAVAEVANMIIGNVKTVLEEKLGPMGLSTPTVIYGRNFEARSVGNREWVIVPFKAGNDELHVQISISPSRNVRGAHPQSGFPITHAVSL
jgi:chemotaxis protein CheX